MADRLAEASKLVKDASKLTTPGLLRWSLDWEQATPMFERAGMLFKVGTRGAGWDAAPATCVGGTQQAEPPPPLTPFLSGTPIAARRRCGTGQRVL